MTRLALALLLAGCHAAPRPTAPPPLAVEAPRPIMPRRDLTPGATDPSVTQANIHETICVPGYSRAHRPSTSVTRRIKGRVMAAYGLTGEPSDYELDHLVSLELAGAPADEKNLWPERWERRGAARGTGAEAKDRVENWLHRAVCDGRVPLAEAQRKIAEDWYQAWVEAGRP